MKNPSKATLFFLAILFLAIGFLVGFSGLTYYQKNNLKSDKIVSGELSIHFFGIRKQQHRRLYLH